MIEQLPDRFQAKIHVAENGCWIWTAAAASGYGRVSWNGRTVGAHRLIWELIRGEHPEGSELDHLCRVTLCVNPDHLEPVTHRENCIRGQGGEPRSRRFAERTTCKRGHALSGDNVYVSQSKGYVDRRCRPCTALLARRRRAAAKAASQAAT